MLTYKSSELLKGNSPDLDVAQYDAEFMVDDDASCVVEFLVVLDRFFVRQSGRMPRLFGFIYPHQLVDDCQRVNIPALVSPPMRTLKSDFEESLVDTSAINIVVPPALIINLSPPGSSVRVATL